jgi:hypothetical protein
MASTAQQAAITDARHPAVNPVLHMMGIAQPRGSIAAGEGASPVAGHERAADADRDGALGATDVEGLTVAGSRGSACSRRRYGGLVNSPAIAIVVAGSAPNDGCRPTTRSCPCRAETHPAGAHPAAEGTLALPARSRRPLSAERRLTRRLRSHDVNHSCCSATVIRRASRAGTPTLGTSPGGYNTIRKSGLTNLPAGASKLFSQPKDWRLSIPRMRNCGEAWSHANCR